MGVVDCDLVDGHGPKKSLLDEEGEGEGEGGLGFNADYADKFKHRKQQEELSNLKNKYGDLRAGEEEESTSESEDSAAELDTPAVEEDFFKTLAALKADDKRIYDKESVFFRAPTDDGSDGTAPSSKKAKPVYLRDHERNRLLTKGDQAFVSDSEDEAPAGAAAGEEGGESYFEKQKRLKQRFLDSAEALGAGGEQEGGEGGGGEGGGLLRSRRKTEAEQAAEEADYAEWLRSGDGAALATGAKEELEPLRRFWQDPKLSENDKYLRDYLTKHLWRQEGAAIPTYHEVVEAGPIDEELDADAVEKQEAFENKFNFRYEEDGATEVKMYARNIETSVRRKDEKRKRQREAREQRKAEDKLRKKEEIKRLKHLKRQEISSKLEQVAQISGAEAEKLRSLGFDLEGEFDPEKHDKMVAAMFGEEYYGADGPEDDKKPTWEEEEAAEAGLYGKYGEWLGGEDGEGAAGDEEGLHVEDDGFIMDADYDPAAAEASGKKKGKKDKKQRKKEKKEAARAAARAAEVASGETGEEEQSQEHGEASRQAQPKADDEKSLAEYLEEYFGLDYEDYVGDNTFRFQYREVEPNNFGLSTAEILAANDKDLNKWVSVKRMSQYRSAEDEEYDLRKYRKRSNNHAKKRQVLASVYEDKGGAGLSGEAIPGILPPARLPKGQHEASRADAQKASGESSGKEKKGKKDKRDKRDKRNKEGKPGSEKRKRAVDDAGGAGSARGTPGAGKISKSRMALYQSLKAKDKQA